MMSKEQAQKLVEAAEAVREGATENQKVLEQILDQLIVLAEGIDSRLLALESTVSDLVDATAASLEPGARGIEL